MTIRVDADSGRRIRIAPARLLARRSELGYTDRLDKVLRSGPEPELEAVPAEYQDLLVMEGRTRFAELQAREHNEELVRREFRSLTSAIKETAVRMSRSGTDPLPLLADVNRVLESHRTQLESRLSGG